MHPVRLFCWHFMAYPYLPSDFDARYDSGWVTVPNTLWDRDRAGDLYQEYIDQLVYADELGFDGMVLNEHHQNIYGLMPSPNIIAAALTQRTKQGKIVVLGNLLPLHRNPLRVAEDIAMLDHMTGGRANAGFARGYQRRWVDVMAPHLHGIHGATPGLWQITISTDQAAADGFLVLAPKSTYGLYSYLTTIDLVEGQPIDVDQSRRGLNLELHQVDQRRAAGDESHICALLRRLCLPCHRDGCGSVLWSEKFEGMHGSLLNAAKRACGPVGLQPRCSRRRHSGRYCRSSVLSQTHRRDRKVL